MAPELGLDIVIAIALVWLSWRVLSEQELFAAAVLFMGFGMLIALAYARLSAPDVALAEAAIGAGVTGVLLLDAVAYFEGRPSADANQPPQRP